MKFMLSVIIPTRNRYQYAEAAVRQILDISDDRIQIIVQDNSDTKELQERLIDVMENPRLNYKYIAERLSGVENFNTAMKRAEGKYVVAIGDDDGISPQIMKCIQWMEDEGVDMVKPNLGLGFCWPNEEECKPGRVSVFKATGRRRILNTRDGVISLLQNGGQDYLKQDMAKSYHGIVRMECMDQVYEKTGAYYGGLSPDIFSAVSLSLLKNKKVVEIDYPFTISGICQQSTSAASANNKHVGRLEDAPHFIGMHDYQWECEVPAMYSVQTIWAETAVKAAKMNGAANIVKEHFDTHELHKKCVLGNYKHKNLILEEQSMQGNCYWGGLYIKYKVEVFVKRVLGYIKRKLGINTIVYGVNTMDEAVKLMQSKFEEKKYVNALNKALEPLNQE